MKISDLPQKSPGLRLVVRLPDGTEREPVSIKVSLTKVTIVTGAQNARLWKVAKDNKTLVDFVDHILQTNEDCITREQMLKALRKYTKEK